MNFGQENGQWLIRCDQVLSGLIPVLFAAAEEMGREYPELGCQLELRLRLAREAVGRGLETVRTSGGRVPEGEPTQNLPELQDQEVVEFAREAVRWEMRFLVEVEPYVSDYVDAAWDVQDDVEALSRGRLGEWQLAWIVEDAVQQGMRQVRQQFARADRRLDRCLDLRLATIRAVLDRVRLAISYVAGAGVQRGGNAHDAEDARQDVAVRILTNGGDPLRPDEPVRNMGAVLARGAINGIIDRVRQRLRERPLGDQTDGLEDVRDQPDQNALHREAFEAAAAAFEELRSDYKQLFILKYLDGAADAVIAYIFDLDPTTSAVRGRLTRARERWRNGLIEAGFDPAVDRFEAPAPGEEAGGAFDFVSVPTLLGVVWSKLVEADLEWCRGSSSEDWSAVNHVPPADSDNHWQPVRDRLVKVNLDREVLRNLACLLLQASHARTHPDLGEAAPEVEDPEAFVARVAARSCQNLVVAAAVGGGPSFLPEANVARRRGVRLCQGIPETCRDHPALSDFACRGAPVFCAERQNGGEILRVPVCADGGLVLARGQCRDFLGRLRRLVENSPAEGQGRGDQ